MKNLNVPIKDSLKTLLDVYSKANGIHKKKVVELALDEYLNKAGLALIDARENGHRALMAAENAK